MPLKRSTTACGASVTELARMSPSSTASPNAEIERLPALAADLVRLGVDIIRHRDQSDIVAAMKATTTHPDRHDHRCRPVSAGLVASLARPAVTSPARTDTGSEILGKRF